MDEKVELADLLPDMVHQRVDLGIVPGLAGKGLRTRECGDQLLDIFLQPVILIVEEQLCTLSGSRLGDCPGDAMLVRHANDKTLLAL
jgi:hypothetical protein